LTELPPPLVRRWVRTATGEAATDLLALARPDDALDPGGISDLVAFGYQAGRRTLIAGVERRFEPWVIGAPEPWPGSLTEDRRADRLWELLRAAVARACAPATAPRASLSGGLDSRAVAAALASLATSGCSAGTFGDPDCADLATARSLAEALGLPHEATSLPADGALRHEERVWRATDGTGGPGAAPGAPTDGAWAHGCDLLLSGCAGDVVWGSSVRPGPSPGRRLRRLGVPFLPPDWDREVPPPPGWIPETGAAAWFNLWTRQAGTTWNGVLPRRAWTTVVPVLWDLELLAFCLALSAEDRQDRRLVRRMLERHAPHVTDRAIPRVRGAPVHDLDRAFATCPTWRAELETWAAGGPRFERVGLRPRAVRRLVRHALAGREPGRSGSISRLRALVRWGALLGRTG
jgi:hypothetical protein